MERYRVVKVTDEPSMGYYLSPSEELIADYLTRAEAKSIVRHLESKYWCKYNGLVAFQVDVFRDGEWHGCSQEWNYTQLEKEIEWFENKGYDYMCWCVYGELRKIG